MIKRFTLRLSDKQHQTLLTRAKKAGLSANDYLLTQLHKTDEQQAMVDVILNHQNRGFDAMLAQLAILHAAQHSQGEASPQPVSGTLTEAEFRAFFGQFLTLFSIWYGKQQLDTLQQKSNQLADKLTAGQCKPAR